MRPNWPELASLARKTFFFDVFGDQPSPLVLPWLLRHLVVWFAWKIPNS